MPSVKELLSAIHSQESLNSHSYVGVGESEKKTLAEQGFKTYEGKVREIASKDGHVYLYHTDRLSAFDCYIGLVPYKGVLLTQIASFWLQKSAQLVPNHFIDCPHPRVIKALFATPIKAEVIVRGYLAGSMLRAYQQGERIFCGITLPDGLKPFQQLPTPIITPTSKAEVFEHDENLTKEDIITREICSRDEYESIEEKALSLFDLGQKIYGERGWILVDTKYEFGKTPEGEIIIIDEIHTPDSSRLWEKATYEARFLEQKVPEMLDKEIVRRYLLERGFKGDGQVPEVPSPVLVALAQVYQKVATTLLGHDVNIPENINQTWLP